MRRRLRGCCFCFSLRTGALAIGILQIVLDLLLLSVTVGLAAYEASQPHPETVSWEVALDLCLTAVHVLFASLLVHGARRERRGMVLAWLVYNGIWLSLQVAAVLAAIVVTAMYELMLPLAVGLAMAALTALEWYWLLAVLSYYIDTAPEVGFVYRRHEDVVESTGYGELAEAGGQTGAVKGQG